MEISAINLQNIILTITGIVAIITIYHSYTQSRYKSIITYYEKTQEIRQKVLDLKAGEQEKAQSILRRSLNFYDVLSYLILNNAVNEKDAFNLLKKNIFDFVIKCKKGNVSLKEHNYLIALYSRWNRWGVSKYYLNSLFRWGILLLVITLAVYINIIY